MTRTATVSGWGAAGLSGSVPGGIRMESEPGHGLMDGLYSFSRATPGGISLRREPMFANVSAASLLERWMWWNSHPSTHPTSCWTEKR